MNKKEKLKRLLRLRGRPKKKRRNWPRKRKKREKQQLVPRPKLNRKPSKKN